MTAQLVPAYEKALKHGDKRKYEAVLVGFDRDAEKHAKYMEKSKMSFPGLLGSKNKDNAFAAAKKTKYVPELLLLDKDGKVVSDDKKEIIKRLSENS